MGHLEKRFRGYVQEKFFISLQWKLTNISFRGCVPGEKFLFLRPKTLCRFSRVRVVGAFRAA